MPKRKDLKKILVVGAGPIIIGQACEFDYSGTQACKALKDEGYKVILINSNPATIMTDPDVADKTYIEPITIEALEKILKKERPDAILPTMGGQTALNLAMEAEKKGILKKYKIELIGAKSKAISNAEDRKKFRQNMLDIGLDVPKSKIVKNIKEAEKVLKQIGLPAIVRPSFTLGGLGGGIAKNKKDFFKIVKNGLNESPANQVLIEECLEGWKEFEMEVVRDKKDNCIIICSIENVDPMGIHTGDSVTIAPALTLTDKEYQVMRNASIACLRKIGVETGGSNVQFAINPRDGRMVIIEMNPRVSRSSALASKATGFPIAKVATKLAVGYTLDELKNEITKTTPASFEPTIDYVVTKIPRFTFEKFSTSPVTLGTSMKSVGEAMAIGRNFKESLQKALVSLEIGFSGLDRIFELNKNQIEKKLKENIPNKILLIAEAFRKKINIKKIQRLSKIDNWFLEQIKEIVDTENEIIKIGLPKNYVEFNRIKSIGFSDKKLSQLTKIPETIVRKKRTALKVIPVFKKVDTCAAEFKSFTPYMYSTYQRNFSIKSECEANPSSKRKIIILGGGPNRIGQGIEFDYCCCQASFALKEEGFEVALVDKVKDRAWEREWMNRFEPMQFGNQLWVCPTGFDKPRGIVIQMDPGLAFGTGTHETTRLCLEYLDGLDVTGWSVLDYGCGSGVLGIGAVLKGAESVVAIDNDPQSLTATQENAERNDVSLEVSMPGSPMKPADLVFANILAGPLVELASQLLNATKSGGLLVLSGIKMGDDQALVVHTIYELVIRCSVPRVHT